MAFTDKRKIGFNMERVENGVIGSLGGLTYRRGQELDVDLAKDKLGLNLFKKTWHVKEIQMLMLCDSAQ